MESIVSRADTLAKDMFVSGAETYSCTFFEGDSVLTAASSVIEECCSSSAWWKTREDTEPRCGVTGGVAS
jgi:hypothetical protein